MRNLKKVLSLVLALMMVLSVMVTANAAFEDVAEDSNYKEAIEVLVAAGVLNGKSETSFDPQGTLTRREAAKIITYVLLGGDVPAVTADALAHPFTDVAKGQWFTNPINYCYAQGIINGTSATTFDPTGELDGYAFAKMLLTACGIVDDYLGTNYKPNVSKNAYANGLLNGLPASFLLSSKLTREQAAQMAFNAINKAGATTNGYWAVELNGTWIQVSAEQALLYSAMNYKVEWKTETVVSNAFGSALKLGMVSEINPEGLNIHYWTVKGEKATVDYVDDAYVTTYATGTAYSKIASDLGVAKENNKVSAKWFANGEYKETLDVVSYLDSKLTTQAPVAVYADGANSYKLLATIEYLATATVAKEAEKDGKNKGLYEVKFAVENGYTETVYAAKDEYVDGAKYLVVPQGDDTTPNGFLSVEPATAVTVTVTATGKGYVKAGTTTYYAAPGREATAFAGINLADKDRTWVLVLSSEGTVITSARPVGETPVVSPEVLVYVTDHYSITTPAVPSDLDKYGNPIPNTGSPAKTTWYAQGVDVDGQEVSYVVAAEDTSVEGKLVAVKYDTTNKVYTFATAESVVELKLDAAKKNVEKGGLFYYYNTASYVTVNGSLDKLVVGQGNLKGAAAAEKVYAIYTAVQGTKNCTVSKVFYVADTTPVAPDTTYSYSILADDSVSTDAHIVTVKDKDGKDVDVVVYTHYVHINGKDTPVVLESNTLSKGMYKYAVNEYGIYELVELTEGVYDATITNVYGDYVTDTGAMADYDITGVELVDLREGDAADGKLEIGDAVVYYAVDTNNDKVVDITLIYIVG